jgi:hypothetical protein
MKIGQKVEEEEGWLLNQWQWDAVRGVIRSLVEITVEGQATTIPTTIIALVITTTTRIPSSTFETGCSMPYSSKQPWHMHALSQGL